MDRCTNPFLEYYQEDVVDEEQKNVTEFRDNEETTNEASAMISADSVAEYLIRNRFLLTALEYHTELLERGHELARLNKFFSNPGNFVEPEVRNPSDLYRSNSIGTFDSLELTQSEDDCRVEDRVAVLEFELRQANDTIRSLRESLTGTLGADSFLKMNKESNRPDDSRSKGIANSKDDAEFSPLVKRALNYLINEYLLQNGLKLSSITLAEEIDDQDFDDWDDVGLNMSKPSNLFNLFQEYSTMSHQTLCFCDLGVQTDDCKPETQVFLENCEVEKKTLKDEILQLKCKIVSMTKERECTSGINNLSMLPERKFDNSNVSLDVITEQNVFPVMWYQVYSFLNKSNTWLFAETSKAASSPYGVVSSISSILPEIIFSMDIEVRGKLIPILLVTAAMQNDASVRYSLMHSLFNLIDKPDKGQRQMILSGCVAYSKLVGPVPAEEDVLPQFWEQIGHKFSERRLLVAEACGSIAPFLRPDIRGSLLLSILQQMEQEENVDEVRIEIVKSLAIVLVMLEDKAKFLQLLSWCEKLANNSTGCVHQSTCYYLLPVLGSIARQSGKFCETLFENFVANLESALNGVVAEGSDQSSQADSFVKRVKNIQSLLPSMLCTILLSMPGPNNETVLDSTDIAPVEFHDEAYHLDWILQSEEQYLELYGRFMCHASTKNTSVSVPFSTCVYNFMPRLIDVVRKIELGNMECIRAMCGLFSSLVRLFGVPFAKNYLNAHQFDITFVDEPLDIESAVIPEINSDGLSLLPVYLCGILGTSCVAQMSEIQTFLHEVLVKISLAHMSLESLMISLVELRKNDNTFHAVILRVLQESMKNPSKYVRSAAGSLFEVLAAPEVNLMMILNDVLPSLLNLSEDNEIMVRISTLQAFGNLLQFSEAQGEIFDRVISRFCAFVAPADISEPQHEMNVKMVRLMAEVSPKADPKFCNEFVLPHLAAIAAKNNQETNWNKRSTMALAMLDTFSNISFCYIPESLLQSAFIPGLRCLLRDMEKVHPDQIYRVESLMAEMETKLDQRMSDFGNESSLATGGVKSRFFKFF